MNNDELNQKIVHAGEVLKVAVKLSQTYYKKPIVICYSGGKDSDVLLDIAIKTLDKKNFRVLHSHTTLDAPDTVYYIREKFKQLSAVGINCEISYPMYKGKRTSFWRICQQKKMLPTRIMRFCCRILKEVNTPKQIAVVGVRESESKNREGRGEFGLRADRSTVKSAQHVNAMIEFDQDENNTSSFECKIIKGAKKNKAVVCNPIYKLTDSDIWLYIKNEKIKINPLYSKGYKRVGCVGCPMAGKHRKKEFVDNPAYKINFIRLCDYILSHDNKIEYDFLNGEDYFRWWLEEDYKQIRMDI